MSGSSGGGSPIQSSSSKTPTCQDLRIRTQLSSPDPAVLSTLANGDILQIQLAGVQGPLQAVTNNGQVAGAILTKDQARLISCINQGTTYEAEILDIIGGNCQILIYAI